MNLKGVNKKIFFAQHIQLITLRFSGLHELESEKIAIAHPAYLSL